MQFSFVFLELDSTLSSFIIFQKPVPYFQPEKSESRLSIWSQITLDTLLFLRIRIDFQDQHHEVLTSEVIESKGLEGELIHLQAISMNVQMQLFIGWIGGGYSPVFTNSIGFDKISMNNGVNPANQRILAPFDCYCRSDTGNHGGTQAMGQCDDSMCKPRRGIMSLPANQSWQCKYKKNEHSSIVIGSTISCQLCSCLTNMIRK